jgi:hypothetical protein
MATITLSGKPAGVLLNFVNELEGAIGESGASANHFFPVLTIDDTPAGGVVAFTWTDSAGRSKTKVF